MSHVTHALVPYSGPLTLTTKKADEMMAAAVKRPQKMAMRQFEYDYDFIGAPDYHKHMEEKALLVKWHKMGIVSEANWALLHAAHQAKEDEWNQKVASRTGMRIGAKTPRDFKRPCTLMRRIAEKNIVSSDDESDPWDDFDLNYEPEDVRTSKRRRVCENGNARCVKKIITGNLAHVCCDQDGKPL
jgi:hypothetical protein